ncbi:MAG TPA: hypothetical protein VLE53_08770 [Gemmatimonadaceae bacterium]|nr:hypothetical protein [Gemmatimonadaceae bacterium]
MDRLIAVTALLLTATAACGGNDGEGPHASRVARAVPRIEESTGLAFRTPPRLENRTKDEVRSYLEQRFTEELPAAELSGMERVYKRFGLLPEAMDFRQFMLDLLTEQVAGYYDPKTKVLYVVEGGDAELTGITIWHELVHALQDQHFNLDSMQSARDNNDRAMAGQAVVEGQATLEQITSMIGGGNFAAALPGGWERVRQMIREMQGTMPIFASAPVILQETLIFPYLSGAEFMRAFKERHPGQSPFGRMPTSTEQLLHTARYFDARDEPTRVTLPRPATGTVVYSNNLGEFETRILLFEYLRDQASAVRGAAGWDGDQYVLIDTPNGEALAWVTVWDTSIDAAEFFDLFDAALIKRHGEVRPGASTGTTRSYGTRGRRLTLTISDVGARPVILFTDVPPGVSPRVIDLSRVTLQE